MKTYTKANEEVHDRVKTLIQKYHESLQKYGVKIDLLFVASNSEGPALSHAGYPAYAVVRALGPKERTMDRGDAEIVIDEEEYAGMSEETRDALLDHELHHLGVKLDQDLRPIMDENGRPKIRLRKHDRQFGWFDAIAERHGSASIEVKQATNLFATTKQLYFGFALPAGVTMSVKVNS